MKKIFYTMGPIVAATIPAIGLVSCAAFDKTKKDIKDIDKTEKDKKGIDKTKKDIEDNKVVVDSGVDESKKINTLNLDLSISDRTHYWNFAQNLVKFKKIMQKRKGFIIINLLFTGGKYTYKINLQNLVLKANEVYFKALKEIMTKLLQSPKNYAKLTETQKTSWKKGEMRLDVEDVSAFGEKIKNELNTNEKYHNLLNSKAYMSLLQDFTITKEVRVWFTKMLKYTSEQHNI